MPVRRRLALSIVLLSVAPSGRPLGAQPAAAVAAPAGARGVAGQVVEAESGAPIEGATVVLLPSGAGAVGGVLTGDAGAGPFVAVTRSAVSDAAGRYRFDGVAAGQYTLRVVRLGFRPATVEVELRGDEGSGGGTRVSVGLTVVPIRLRPVEVIGAGPEPFARHARSVQAVGDTRLAALRQRQSRFLSTDVREVTQADVAEGVTLGETDLFRALQRLPGVSTRNDLTAELWTRGGRWDQTRVTWDGLPLYNPLHVGGMLSAVNADAVGAAFLHPGVRPAALGEGGAAVLDLRSRAGGGDGALRGVGEVSLLSARATLDQRVAGGRGAWMLSARRSYADWAVPAIGRTFFDDDTPFPYHFAEVAARGDWRLGHAHALEASVLRSQDHLTGDLPDLIQQSRARWGNTAARLTLTGPARLGPLGVVALRHTLGFSGYVGRTRVGVVDSAVERRSAAESLRPVQGDVRDLTLAGEVAPVPAADGDATPGRAAWTAGWELSHQTARGEGALRLPYVAERTDSAPGRLAGGVTQLAVWGERRLHPAPRLTVAAGLRAEAGTAVPGAGLFGALRLAPRLAGRYALGDGQTFVSAGAGRSYQYVQAAPRSEVSGDWGLSINTPVPLWAVAGARGEGDAAGVGAVPVLRADLATVGVERWLGAGWQAAANGYHRRTAGVLLDDPRPGLILRSDPLFVVGGEAATGVELGVRRVVGRWTAAGSYTLARTRATAAGLTYPSPQDQRHVFSGTTMWRAGAGLRLGAAYTTFSGAPYTRGTLGDVITYGDSLVEVGPNHYRLVRDSVAYGPGVREAPGAARLPRFARLDALVDWSGRVWRVRMGAFLQVHNVLLRTANPLGARASSYCTAAGDPTFVPGCSDYVQTSFSIAPVLGLRLSF